ncbi:hypothetical protein LMG24235_08440 [Paraburkholderia sabiae]|nr:hypothetical protein LMG24235_08440 [Paraburkholderia sabiae]
MLVQCLIALIERTERGDCRGRQAEPLADIAQQLAWQCADMIERVTTGTQKDQLDRDAGTGIPPKSLERPIEMPARLILSTAQDAIWWTPRRLPLDRIVASSALPHSPRDIDTRTTKLEDGATVIGLGVSSRSGPWHLWSARLLVDRQHPEKPGVRAVASPDLRPKAMDGAPRGSRIRLPGAGAPMPGPWAPWYLGAEQSESGAQAEWPRSIASTCRICRSGCSSAGCAIGRAFANACRRTTTPSSGPRSTRTTETSWSC